jgi:hypothetical protein
LAQITVDTAKAVSYDRKLLYHGGPYSVQDSYENYLKSIADVADGLITVTEAFTNLSDDSSAAIPVVAEAPVNAVAASAIIGTGDNGQVTITYATKGEVGNSLTVQTVLAADVDAALDANVTNNDMVITLGTDATGAADDTKNTATLIAALIDSHDEFSAEASGTGADAIAVMDEPDDFAGGVNGTIADGGIAVQHGGYVYFAIADNGIGDANWVRVQGQTF